MIDLLIDGTWPPENFLVPISLEVIVFHLHPHVPVHKVQPWYAVASFHVREWNTLLCQNRVDHNLIFVRIISEDDHTFWMTYLVCGKTEPSVPKLRQWSYGTQEFLCNTFCVFKVADRLA